MEIACAREGLGVAAAPRLYALPGNNPPAGRVWEGEALPRTNIFIPVLCNAAAATAERDWLMALKYRKPGQTTPTRSLPLTAPDTGAAGQWTGYLAMAISVVLALVAWFVPNTGLQLIVLVALAALLAGVALMGVRALRASVGAHELPAQVWPLLAGALVVAATLGAVVALLLR